MQEEVVGKIARADIGHSLELTSTKINNDEWELLKGALRGRSRIIKRGEELLSYQSYPSFFLWQLLATPS